MSRFALPPTPEQAQQMFANELAAAQQAANTTGQDWYVILRSNGYASVPASAISQYAVNSIRATVSPERVANPRH
jgi:hypothetical protein